MKIKINHKKFFDGYKAHFGAFTAADQPTIEGIEFFLTKFDRETRLKNIPQFAYVLATTYHESHRPRTGQYFQPVKEGRERASSPRRANQDEYWLTGYYGRGFPQTTWKENYLKSGEALGLGDLFVKNPDLLLTPEYAYEAMVICMVKGLYRTDRKTRTKNTLDKYLPDDHASEAQYIRARDIINGDIAKNGKLIAGYAIIFEKILRASILSNSHNQSDASEKSSDLPPDEFREPLVVTEQAETSPAENAPPPEKEWTEGERPPENAPPEPPIPVVQAVAEETKPEPPDALAKASGWFDWINGKFLALPPALGAAALGFYNWLTQASVYLTLGFFGASALIGITYLCWFMYLKNQRENRAAKERADETALKMQREQQAFQITLKQMESAMRRDLNTVTVVPKPLENSDSATAEEHPEEKPTTFFRSTPFLGEEI